MIKIFAFFVLISPVEFLTGETFNTLRQLKLYNLFKNAKLLRTTEFPSEVPSLRPSKQSSNNPSKRPATSPSKSPSKILSHGPSKFPSKLASPQPSLYPSQEASASPSKKSSNNPSKRPAMSPSKLPSKSKEPSKSPRPTEIPSHLPSLYPTFSEINSPKISFKIESSPFEIFLDHLKISTDSTIHEKSELAISLISTNIDNLLLKLMFPQKNGVSVSFLTDKSYDYFLDRDEVTNLTVYDESVEKTTQLSLSLKMKKQIEVKYNRKINDNFVDNLQRSGTELLDEGIKLILKNSHEAGGLLEVLINADSMFKSVEVFAYRRQIDFRLTDTLIENLDDTEESQNYTIFKFVTICVGFIFAVTVTYRLSFRAKRISKSEPHKRDDPPALDTNSSELISEISFLDTDSTEDKETTKPLDRFKLRVLDKRLESHFKMYLGGNLPSKEDTYYFQRANNTEGSLLEKYTHVKRWIVCMGNIIETPLELKKNDSNATFAVCKKKNTGKTIVMDDILEVDEDEDSEEDAEKAEIYKKKRMRQLKYWRKCENIHARSPSKSTSRSPSRTSSKSPTRRSKERKHYDKGSLIESPYQEKYKKPPKRHHGSSRFV